MAGTSSTMRLGGWRRTDRRQYHRRKNHPVNTRKFHEIWVEQGDATLEDQAALRVKPAFDYLVNPKSSPRIWPVR